MTNNQSRDVDTLAHFLNEANKNTYANKAAAQAPASRLHSEDYHFEKDGLIYHDTYFGGRDFIGEEIVYKDQKPIWGANYFGIVLADEIGAKDIYDFLRKSLMQDYDDVIPVRGPSSFSEGNWRYRFSAPGDLTNFSGEEEILLHEKVVYRLLIHGGFIR